MLITLNQLKASLVAFKNWVLARIPSKTSDLTNDSGFITAEDEAVKDVQVNGTSILDEGVANIPVAGMGSLGVVKIDGSYGIQRTSDGLLYIYAARDAEIKAGTNQTRPLSPKLQHASTFYGLAKASGDTTQSASDNPIGTYTAEAKTAIQTMLGVPSTADIPTKVSDLVDDSGHYTKPSTGIPASDLASGVVPVQDVQINMGSLLDSNGVANIPNAGIGQLGVAQTNPNYGTISGADGIIRTCLADATTIKTATNTYNPIVPSNQHTATFYGLAKAAGDTTQSASSNAVGTYTDEAKAAIKTMLGIDTITVDSIPTTEIDTLFA